MFQNNLLMAADAATSGTSLVSVGNSALFNQDNSEYLSRTPAGAGNRDTWTFSTWVYRTQQAATDTLFTGGADSSNNTVVVIWDNGIQYLQSDSGSFTDNIVCAPDFRDIGWYHVVIAVDTTQAVEANRVIMYSNGALLPLSSANYPAQNVDTDINSTSPHAIGAWYGSAGHAEDGYMAETVLIDGLQLTPTSFGEFDSTGLYWTPLASATIKALTFGTNGFYLDNTTNAETDASGNGNNWTNNNTVTLSTHTPTNLNMLYDPLHILGTPALSNGNQNNINNAVTDTVGSTLSINASSATGFYFEIKILATTGNGPMCGLQTIADPIGTYATGNGPIDVAYWGIAGAAAYMKQDSVTVAIAGAQTPAVDQVLMIAVKNGNFYIGGSNGWWNSADPDAETGAKFTNLVGYYRFYNTTSYANTTGIQLITNEDNYTYTPPTGYLNCDTNSIAADSTRTASDTTKYWNNLLYTGNGTAIGSGGNAITGAGFQPDFVWLKNRSAADSHQLTDSVRGVTKNLSSDATTAEGTDSEGLTTFGSDGFTVGSDVSYNTNTETYVAWCAKLGGAPTATNSAGAGATPTAGSVKIDGVNLGSALAGSIACTKLSVNTTLNMSIGTFTGTAANATIGHGLGVIPEFIICRSTATATSWVVYHIDNDPTAPQNKYLTLENANAVADAAELWNDTAPTSSVFSVGSSTQLNPSGTEGMFMAFAPSQFISIGSYEGNGSTDGTFVPTVNSLGVPIQPVFWIVKNIDYASNWIMSSTARNTYNKADICSFPNLTNAEGNEANVDVVTGGLKYREAANPTNNGYTYVYIAVGTPIIDTDGRIIAGF